VCLLIDGNDFPVYTLYDEGTDAITQVRHETVEGGDNLYTCIAAASILAKVARDDYIDALCRENPELVSKYGIDKNKGYGTKKHLDGIREHGVTELHRKSYRPCAIPI
jgi:ribonuclease HII